MFIVQPEHGFGHIICNELLSEQSGQRRWQTVEFAVAWSNNAGVDRIFDSVRKFLSEGGSVRVTAGLDFGRTTYEGLGKLLTLEHEADMTTHVFFDENPACTFHPKVFLFKNDSEACLLVGSNNMTGAGFESNVEAALGFSGSLEDETVRNACQALAAWRDTGSDSRIRRLTRDFLEQLKDCQYVLTEEEIRKRRRSEEELRAATALPLFGRSSIRPLRPGRRNNKQKKGVGRTTGSALGEVLLMRLRPRRNGNQVQISMKILEASFMNGVEEVVSVDGAVRRIGYNMTKGRGVRNTAVRNTARFEAPEMRDMINPVARFQWVNAGGSGQKLNRILQYEIFDAESDIEGQTILTKLWNGIADHPLTKLEELSQEETVLSIGNRDSAQWYRLDSA